MVVRYLHNERDCTMMPINFIVVRHGESVGNFARSRSEAGDNSVMESLQNTHIAHWPLTKKGIAQAKKTGQFINQHLINDEKMIFDRMYVSPFARAMETAGYLDLIRAQWIIDSRISERDWGELDRMMSDDERERLFSEILKKRKTEPFFFTPPHGESMNTFTLRTSDFIDRLHEEDKTNIIAVCHGEVAKNFRTILFGHSPMEYAETEFSQESSKRIHNCQIDHYTRRDPKTLLLSDRLEWFRFYRPTEGRDETESDWQHIPSKRRSSYDLLQMAGKLSATFEGERG